MKVINASPTKQPIKSAGPKAGPSQAPDPVDRVDLGGWLQQAKEGWDRDGWVYAAGAGMYAGVGTVMGSLVGAPLVGAVKGLEIFTTQAVGDAIMNTPSFQSGVFNWSKTMPAEADTPKDIDYSDPKTSRLFHANLGTNLGVCLAVPAAIGGIVFGLPGALAVASLALVAAPFAEAM